MKFDNRPVAERDNHRRLVLPETSPMSGLNRRSLGSCDVLAQSVGVIAPSGAAITIPALVIAITGAAALWAMAIALVVALLVATTINQFTVRVASVGSLYTFTAKGLGPTAAYLSGAGLILGYGFVAVYAFANIGLHAGELAQSVVPATIPGPVIWACCIAVAAILCTVLLTHRIAVSARIALVAEIAAVTTVLVLGGVLLGRRGVHNIDWQALALPDVSAHQLILGSGLALMALIGFESGAALSVEAKQPFATIPRALTSSLLATGALMLVATATHPALAPQAENRASPLLSGLSDSYEVDGLAQLLDAAVVVSFFACALASVTALIRVLLSMSIDAVAPAWLGRIDRVSRVPRTPVYLVMPIVAVLPIVLLATADSTADVLATVAIASVSGLLIAYLLVCLAAPAFLRKIGESTPRQTLLASTAAAGLATCLIMFVTAHGNDNDRYIAMLLVGIALVAAVALRALSRRADRIGTHDYPTRAEILELEPADRQGDS
ncbi:APC family permease [Nocardia colli]|uniref:APC family permease n=1 Tax=Nocardia colli TaxID=2545717 RepID=A0A5N0EMG0_9NOCA|nr:APC family permease [Nocardia colli]KAA8889464.1 APC family permease [Nocardia colli]